MTYIFFNYFNADHQYDNQITLHEIETRHPVLTQTVVCVLI